MHRGLALIVFPLFLTSCGRGPIAPHPPASIETGRVADHRARFLLDTAAQSVQEALTRSRSLLRSAPSNAKENMSILVDLLDDSGSTLAELAATQPSVRRSSKRVVDGVNEALTALTEARGIADGLAGVAPEKSREKLATISALVNDGIDSATQALVELGGKVVPAVEEPVSRTN